MTGGVGVHRADPDPCCARRTQGQGLRDNDDDHVDFCPSGLPIARSPIGSMRTVGCAKGHAAAPFSPSLDWVVSKTAAWLTIDPSLASTVCS